MGDRSEPVVDSDKIMALLGVILEPIGYQVVRLELQMRRRTPLVRVYVDRLDAGRVSIDDCVQATRALDNATALDDCFPGSYELEVSSPGAERPLVRPEDYVRFQGCRASVTVRGEDGSRRRIVGRILGLEGQELSVEQEGGGHVTLDLSRVVQANLKPTNEELFKKAEISA